MDRSFLSGNTRITRPRDDPHFTGEKKKGNVLKTDLGLDWII